MPFEWFVALRYLRDGRSQTALILSAVAVGVAVIVFLSALINGLQAKLIEQTLGAQAHVTLLPPEEVARPLDDGRVAVARSVEKASQRLRSIDSWPGVLSAVARVPGVIAAAPTVSGAGTAERGAARRPVLVRGIEPESFTAIVDLQRRLTAGRFDVSGATVVIGVDLAADLGVGVGDKLRLTTSEGGEAVEQIAGLFDLGVKAVNQTWVVTSLRQAQSLFGLPGGATTLELKVASVFDAEAAAREVAALTGLRSESWMQLNAQLLTGLRAQESSKWLIELFVVIAVALGIASVLIVSVVQKSREIGILRACGAPAQRVLRVFLVQGGVLGLAGSLLGCVLGAGLGLFFQGLVRNPDGSPTFTVLLTPLLFSQASLLAIGIGLAAAVLPARRAARMDPAEAIRHG
jgi:lipoprotein-releasing system permease protein